MAKGVPKRWAMAMINQPVSLGKPGITNTIWDKWGRTHEGTLTGLNWGAPLATVQLKKPPRA